jgi:hypothetical protein
MTTNIVTINHIDECEHEQFSMAAAFDEICRATAIPPEIIRPTRIPTTWQRLYEERKAMFSGLSTHYNRVSTR